MHHFVEPSANESFWQSLTNTAYWQVLLALIVAYSTYYFTDRSRRKAQFARAKSQAIRYGYELQQAYSNRLQSELKSNYYEQVSKFQSSESDKVFFRNLAKDEALSNPQQSILISQIYGRLIEQYGIIEQLGNTSDYNLVKGQIDLFVFNHGSLKVLNPSANYENIGDVENYNKKGHKDIEKIIDESIKIQNIQLKKSLETMRLKLF